VLPIVGVLGSYRRGWIVRDALAAVTICAVLVPQALAYGQLAGLSPVDGLYAALAPLVLYPLFASSRRLMAGPESGLAILTAVALAPLAAEGSAKFAVLAAMLALLTGAVLILAGLLRLGFLADFFSRPVLLGFINGVAAIILVSQLPQFLGIKVQADSTLGTLWQVLRHIGDAQWRAIVLGIVLVIVLALLGRFARRVPGALVALVSVALPWHC
jgi:SulP family sulfate permease